MDQDEGNGLGLKDKRGFELIIGWEILGPPLPQILFILPSFILVLFH